MARAKLTDEEKAAEDAKALKEIKRLNSDGKNTLDAIIDETKNIKETRVIY